MNTTGITIYNNDSFSISKDTQEIKESVIRIIMTRKRERLNKPEFGSNFQKFLFNDILTIDGELQSEVYNCITKWEPRVQVTMVKIDKNNEEHTATLSIILKVKDSGQIIPLEFGFSQ